MYSWQCMSLLISCCSPYIPCSRPPKSALASSTPSLCWNLRTRFHNQHSGTHSQHGCIIITTTASWVPARRVYKILGEMTASDHYRQLSTCARGPTVPVLCAPTGSTLCPRLLGKIDEAGTEAGYRTFPSQQHLACSSGMFIWQYMFALQPCTSTGVRVTGLLDYHPALHVQTASQCS